MKNIFDQLQEEHDEAMTIVDQLLDTSEQDEDRRQRLFPRLQHLMLAHCKAEELELYRRVRDLSESIESEIEDDIEEHGAIEDALERLAAMRYDAPRWLDVLGELRECLSRHFDDEENELFPEVEEHLTEQQAAELGELYRAEKQSQLEALVGDEYSEMTKDELYERAKDRGIPGRSRMSKDELIQELRHQ